MKTQIPVYRAKRKDNGEWVEGALLPSDNRLFISTSKQLWITEDDGSRFRSYCASSVFEIDPETLAIHFPDMIDKNSGRIFAALNKSGVGGSIDNYDWIFMYRNGKVRLSKDKQIVDEFDDVLPYLEITGIYEGETK